MASLLEEDTAGLSPPNEEVSLPAPPQAPPTTTDDSPLLLREWNHAGPSTASLEASSTSPSPAHLDHPRHVNLPPSGNENDEEPPVAPAVAVVVEEATPTSPGRPLHRLASSSSSAYPVANLVRDFLPDLVRTTVDQFTTTASSVTSSMGGHMRMMGHMGNAATDDRNSATAGSGISDPSQGNLSIRSDSAAYARSSTAGAAPVDPYTVSARTVPDLLDESADDGAEYILVDGDLIAIPATHQQHYRHHDDEEDEDDGYLAYDTAQPSLTSLAALANPTKACRSNSSKGGRMQRGIRKVRKFFTRKRNQQYKPRPDDFAFAMASNEEGEEVGLPIHLQPPVVSAIEPTGHPPSLVPPELTDEDSLRIPASMSPPHSPSSSFVAAAASSGRTANLATSTWEGDIPPPGASSVPPPTSRREKRKQKAALKKQQAAATMTTSTSPTRGQSLAALRNRLGTEEGDQKPRSRPPRTAQYPIPPPDTLYPPPTAAAPFSSDATGGDDALMSTPYAAAASPPYAAAAAVPASLMTSPPAAAAATREQSVTASFVGTADGVLEAGIVLPAAEAFIEGYYNSEWDEKLKRDDAIPASLVPTDTDYKVDKEHAPDVEAMLRRAEQETLVDLDMMSEQSLTQQQPRRKRGKIVSGVTVPLSQACPTDDLVHNDSLKVVLVGSPGVDKTSLSLAIRQSNKKPKMRKSFGVEVHTWTASDIRFHLWDVQGATQARKTSLGSHFSTNSSAGGFGSRGSSGSSGGYEHTSGPDFGAHPGTQSLFFSSQSLYLLVWDLACNNPHTHPVLEDNSDDEDDHNDWSREEASKQADRALREDIESRVLSWVDRIARRGPRSAILPVGLIPDGMPASEARRRCDRLYELLETHMAWYEYNERAPNVVLDDSKNILCVNYSSNDGIEQLQETIVAIATDTSSSVFTHVGTPVPNGVVEVLDLLGRLKEDHKLIWVDHIIGELGSSVPVEDVINALCFLSSIGEILYFGSEGDEVLSQFVVLNRRWLVSAISCILRNNLRQELIESRRFMQMQCLYSEQEFAENDITRTFANGAASNCPLLSGEDAQMLWQSMNFMREAADRYWQLNESSTAAPTMFYFLERLLVHSGIFLPLGVASDALGAGMNRDEVYFVPSLLSRNDPGDVWTSKDIWSYRNSDSFLTTLCHSWLFRDGAPSDLFEHITVAVLKDVFEFSKDANAGQNPREPLLQRSQTVPLGHNSMHDFVDAHDGQAIGSVRIQQVVCWNSALLVKIATIFPDNETNQVKESSVEIFVTIANQNATYAVASDAMRANMQRIIVSGKGPVGHHGRKLYKGGYQAVIDSVQRVVGNFNNVNAQVICPNCLAHGNPRKASTWSYEEVLASSEERTDSTIVCRRGHRIKSNLLTGKNVEGALPDLLPGPPAPKSVSDLLPSVVLIGLLDLDLNRVRNVGSGFVADKKYGLIVTAGHVLFQMDDGKDYGTPYFGLPNAKVVVGVIPEAGKDEAVFRYLAEIVADDIRSNIDACVIRITSRMEKDVVDDGTGCATQPQILLDSPDKIKAENLVRLKMETEFQLEESIRIIGYNQGGEGIYEPGSHILRSADLAKGFICRMFTAANSDDSDDSSTESDSEANTFSPREEIVAICPTISGHSGGPCVNGDGLVIGILSRADPVDRNRCYLVPASQLKTLLKRARNACTRPIYTTQAPTKAASQILDRSSSV